MTPSIPTLLAESKNLFDDLMGVADTIIEKYKKKNMNREKLKAKNESVFTESGRYLFTVSFTDKATSLINDEGRNAGESWLGFRNRTKGEREQEQLIRENTAKEIADAYNEKYFK